LPNGLRARDAILYSRGKPILSVIEDQLPQVAETQCSRDYPGIARCTAANPCRGDVKLLVQQANPPSRVAQLPNFVCEILATRRSLILRRGGKNVEAHHEAVAAGESM
jgi:hypothetical protein